MTDEQRENAALYALGLLEAEELSAFEAALGHDSELGSLIAEHRAVLAIVSLSPEIRTPPESLRQSILTKATEATFEAGPSLIEPDEPVSPAPDFTRPEPGPFGGTLARILPWALAASFAIGFAVLLYQVNGLKKQNVILAQQARPENFQIATLAAQSAELPGISASVAWNATNGTGILETVSLPAQPADKTYQLWVFEKDNPSPVSAGIFDPAKGTRVLFEPERPVSNAAAFAVSIEVAGGRPQPEGAVVLVGNLQGT